MTDRLQSTLASLGVTDFAIKSVYAIEFGCVVIDPDHPPPLDGEASPGNGGEVEDAGTEPSLRELKPNERLLHLLKRTPSVFDIVQIDERRPRYTVCGSSGICFSGDLLNLSVRVPARLQKYAADHFDADGPIIEQFGVLTDGSLFAAYAELADAPQALRIGHEYRGLIATHPGDTQSDKLVVIGPCPIHLTVYLIVRQRPTDFIGDSLEVRSDEFSVFVIVDDDGSDPAELVRYVFEQAQFPLIEFCRVLCARVELLNQWVELNSHFDELAAAVSTLVSTAWWKLVPAAIAVRTARAHLVEAHGNLVSLESGLRDHQRDIARVGGLISENLIFGQRRKYFDEMAEAEIELPESLSAAMSYYSSEILASRNARSMFGATLLTVIATLTGAAVGAMLAHG